MMERQKSESEAKAMAYRRGAMARIKGLTRAANPNDKKGPLFGPWDQGWKDRNKKLASQATKEV